jgi:hypothetical protein
MTPSKRCTIEGATALRGMLQTGLEFVEDPRNPSPDRRQMYALLQRAGQTAVKRAKSSRDGNSVVLAPVEEFVKRQGHDCNPNQFPTRCLSAAERGRKQRVGAGAVIQQKDRARSESTEVALELGLDGQFDLSESRLALNERRLPRSISDRSERLIRDFHKKHSKDMR